MENQNKPIWPCQNLIWIKSSMQQNRLTFIILKIILKNHKWKYFHFSEKNVRLGVASIVAAVLKALVSAVHVRNLNIFSVLCIHTVDNKKTRTPCFPTLRFSRISPEPLKLQKIYLHFCTSVFKELSAGTEIFQIRWHNQLILAKMLIFQ